MARAYEVDASSMCDVLSGVPGVDDVSLEFDSRGNGVLRVRLRPDVDEDAVVGAAVAQLHRRFGVGMEGGRLRLTGPSGRTVVAVVEPHGRARPRRAPQPTAAAAPAPPAAPAPTPHVTPRAAPDVVQPAEHTVDARATDLPAHDVPSAASGHAVANGHVEVPHAGVPELTDVPGLADEPDTRPVPERRTLERSAADVPVRAVPEPAPQQPGPDLQPGPELQREDELDAEPRPEPRPEPQPEPAYVDRLVLNRVEVATGRLELWATVELRAGDVLHTGTSSATATGTGAHRAVVAATARAAESALGGQVRIDVEAVDLLGVGTDQVGVVVVTLLTERGVDRVSGAALVKGDGRETLVRATLDALNRRTESLQQGRLSPPS